MKNPLTLAEIEPVTFLIVVQHLNHCATTVPDHWGRATIIQVSQFSSNSKKITEKYITLSHSYPMDLILNRTNAAHICCYLSSFRVRRKSQLIANNATCAPSNRIV